MSTYTITIFRTVVVSVVDNTFFLISLFKMRHVIFSLNEYVMLCYINSVN